MVAEAHTFQPDISQPSSMSPSSKSKLGHLAAHSHQSDVGESIASLRVPGLVRVGTGGPYSGESSKRLSRANPRNGAVILKAV